VTPAERAGRKSRGGGPEGSNEISPAAASALMASFTRRHGISPPRARQLAASLIRCMDSRDTAGADALIARAARGGIRDLDAVVAWVWRLESARARWRAYDAAAAAWRAAHRATLAARLRPLREVIAVLAVAMAEPAERPAPVLRMASETGVLITELVSVLAAAMGCERPNAGLGVHRAA
jgi:hypothetical protein